ncbi:hypothetical protein BO99DRAFT_142135 [Aspergillus violaceofuscus CBS 115571]|uniref:Uncharacterized protein n=1 Tax=Aspergillus violaceofuscus (strain CBS 115571) TaxID=1450538 RepID=A0A2V5HSV7_ASPV1|nr:hypothetical protein BO99DRAFT_142135 [Aspergillus violaceofuscus CBS 115571]
MQVSTSMHFRVWGADQQSLASSLRISFQSFILGWDFFFLELSIVAVGPTLFMVAAGIAFYFHSPTFGSILSLILHLFFCLDLVVGFHGSFSSFGLRDSPAWTDHWLS